MKCLLLALVIVALPAHAFDWPWQQKHRENYSYCKGFVFEGLSAGSVKDLSRIQLWLSWNNVVRAQFEQGGVNQEQYEAGKARFSGLLAANDMESLVQVADGECDFAEI
jgi:hypothetical protein